MSEPAHHSKPRWRSPVGGLLWAAAAAAAGLAMAPLEPNVLEEGIVVHTAQRMLQGEHLYRDVVSHTAPLSYELLALLFRLFGSDIALARGAVVVLQAAGGGLAFAIARRAGAGPFAHVVAAAVAVAPLLLAPLFSTYYYTTLAFYLGLAAVYAALRAPGSTRWALATGVLLAAVALCKQNNGVALVATLGLALVAIAPRGARLRTLGATAGGGLAVALATLTLYAARGDLGNFVYCQVELPLLMGSAKTFQTPLMNLWPPGRLSPVVRANWVMYLPSLYHLRYGLDVVIGRGIVVFTQALYALPLAALAATVLRAAAGGVPAALWAHAAFLATMTLNLYPRADWGHVVVALPPAVAQLALLVGGTRVVRARWAPAASALSVGALALAGVAVGAWLHAISGPPSFGPRVPLRPVFRATRSPAMPRVIRYLRRHVAPGEPIFVARQEPLLYFATDTTNPTPFEGVLQGVRALQEPRILAGLAHVRFVVMSDIDQPLYTFYSDELPAVWAYLERYFRIPPDFPLDDASWITVAERDGDRGATAVDFLEQRARGRAWTRDATDAEVPIEDEPPRLAARHYRRPFPVEIGPRGGGVDFDVEVPAHAVLQADVGYRGVVSVDHQYIHPRGTTAVIAIRPAGASAFSDLAVQRIDDGLRAGRRWTPLEVDLSRWAGQRVTLRLAFRAEPMRRRFHLAWFGSPRIAVRP